jgi:hypothetical protein
MLNFTDETMWLNVTNIALGVVVLVACVVVARVFAAELFERVRHAFALKHSPAHELFVSDLGLTMADGGDRIEKKNAPSSSAKPSADSSQQN